MYVYWCHSHNSRTNNFQWLAMMINVMEVVWVAWVKMIMTVVVAVVVTLVTSKLALPDKTKRHFRHLRKQYLQGRRKKESSLRNFSSTIRNTQTESHVLLRDFQALPLHNAGRTQSCETARGRNRQWLRTLACWCFMQVSVMLIILCVNEAN